MNGVYESKTEEKKKLNELKYFFSQLAVTLFVTLKYIDFSHNRQWPEMYSLVPKVGTMDGKDGRDKALPPKKAD